MSGLTSTKREFSRRRLLQKAGLSACGSGLAGCVEVDFGGDDGDSDDASMDDELGIRHVRFVEDVPTEHREYSKREDASFEQDEQVVIYYEPVGLTTEDAGEDRFSVDISMRLLIEDPDGNTVGEFEDDIAETVEGGADTVFLFWNYSPAADHSPGEYTAVLELVDEPSGEQASETASFTIEGTATYTEQFRVAITEELPIQVDHLAVDGDTVELVYETPNQVPSGEGEFEIGFIAGRFAEQVGAGWDIDGLVAEVTEPAGYRYTFTVSAEAAADYDAGIIDSEQFTNSFLATLEPADVEAFFLTAIDRESTAQPESLDVVGSTAEFEHSSQFAYGQSGASEEIADIGGTFAVVIDEGWTVDRLDATLVDDNGDRFGWYVERTTAEDWLAGRISNDEYADTILDTVEFEE